MRLAKKKHESIPDDENWDIAEEESSIEYGDGLTVERVRKAIEQLPDGYRSVLSLYLLEGYDHQEIAEIMGITESTSKSQLNRAKSKLRELLKTEDYALKIVINDCIRKRTVISMKDPLEDFIHQNRDGFDDKEPSKKVWQDIETAMSFETRRLWNSILLWRAAAIIFMVLSGYLLSPKTVIRPGLLMLR